MCGWIRAISEMRAASVTPQKQTLLKTREPVYRYSYFSKLDDNPVVPPYSNAITDSTRTFKMDFGDMLDMSKIWMLGIESFRVKVSGTGGLTDSLAVLISNVGSVSSKSNCTRAGGSCIINLNATVTPFSSWSSTNFGERITNPNFLNDYITIQIVNAITLEPYITGSKPADFSLCMIVYEFPSS
jgi:hypothetical protein